MVNVAVFEVPPPGAEFTTVTLSEPAAATSAAAISATSDAATLIYSAKAGTDGRAKNSSQILNVIEKEA